MESSKHRSWKHTEHLWQGHTRGSNSVEPCWHTTHIVSFDSIVNGGFKYIHIAVEKPSKSCMSKGKRLEISDSLSGREKDAYPSSLGRLWGISWGP